MYKYMFIHTYNISISISIYLSIYLSISLSLYIYVYIYELCVFCLLQHCRNTCTQWSHWFHIQIIFSSWFHLITVTNTNNLTNCEHDPVINKEARATY